MTTTRLPQNRLREPSSYLLDEHFDGVPNIAVSHILRPFCVGEIELRSDCAHKSPFDFGIALAVFLFLGSIYSIKIHMQEKSGSLSKYVETSCTHYSVKDDPLDYPNY